MLLPYRTDGFLTESRHRGEQQLSRIVEVFVEEKDPLVLARQ